MPSNTKSHAARIPCSKCGGYVGEKLLLLPGEILQTAGRAEPQNLYQLKMYRDGLELQGCQPTHGTLLVQNDSSDLKLMLDQMNRLPPPAASRGTDGTPRMHPGLCAGRSGRCAPRRGWDSDRKNFRKRLAKLCEPRILTSKAMSARGVSTRDHSPVTENGPWAAHNNRLRNGTLFA